MNIDPHAAIEAVKPFAPSMMGAVLGLLHNRSRPIVERLVALLTGMAVASFHIGSMLASPTPETYDFSAGWPAAFTA